MGKQRDALRILDEVISVYWKEDENMFKLYATTNLEGPASATYLALRALNILNHPRYKELNEKSQRGIEEALAQDEDFQIPHIQSVSLSVLYHDASGNSVKANEARDQLIHLIEDERERHQKQRVPQPTGLSVSYSEQRGICSAGIVIHGLPEDSLFRFFIP